MGRQFCGPHSIGCPRARGGASTWCNEIRPHGPRTLHTSHIWCVACHLSSLIFLTSKSMSRIDAAKLAMCRGDRVQKSRTRGMVCAHLKSGSRLSRPIPFWSVLPQSLPGVGPPLFRNGTVSSCSLTSRVGLLSRLQIVNNAA